MFNNYAIILKFIDKSLLEQKIWVFIYDGRTITKQNKE
jgi:hypothetical protein